MEIIFIRHGATAGNLERRYIGRTDEPLCPLGVEQIEKLKGLFEPDYLFVSPMLRTRLPVYCCVSYFSSSAQPVSGHAAAPVPAG